MLIHRSPLGRPAGAPLFARWLRVAGATLLIATLGMTLASRDASAECRRAYTTAELGEDLGSLTIALRELDEARFKEAGARVESNLMCVAEPIPTPVFASAYRYVGALHFLIGDTETARSYFRSSLELDPTFDWGHQRPRAGPPDAPGVQRRAGGRHHGSDAHRGHGPEHPGGSPASARRAGADRADRDPRSPPPVAGGEHDGQLRAPEPVHRWQRPAREPAARRQPGGRGGRGRRGGRARGQPAQAQEQGRAGDRVRRLRGRAGAARAARGEDAADDRRWSRDDRRRGGSTA